MLHNLIAHVSAIAHFIIAIGFICLIGAIAQSLRSAYNQSVLLISSSQ
jgi:hypothetical protein